MRKVLLIGLAVMVLAGCATPHPVQNINAEPVVAPAGRAIVWTR